MAQQLAEDEGIRIPYIDLELSHHDMLVIEWIDGVRIDDVDALVTAGHNIDQITEIAATSFFNQVFRDGYFHGGKSRTFLDAQDSGRAGRGRVGVAVRRLWPVLPAKARG